MKEEEFRELYLRIIQIYRLSPEVAQQLLERILDILHNHADATDDP